ncbi:hypothetical protein [Endozoicomonas sp. GU-1]|uniref:hypothetical protein n=2 Tax=Endozoicomonas TaxID=305899 RepID=UPI0022B34F12|nr:hypothetical protein [Endozoicomonas sp. GU-1]WBA84922.1 hypothetical protein O3276_16820 [Endozoicomonas sp. GU-1]
MSMTPLQLLTYLELQGVRLAVDSTGILKAVGPKSVLTPVTDLFRYYKPELVSLITQDGFDILVVKEALRFISNGLAVTPELLVLKYFTPEDLMDLSTGQYRNLTALRDLIISDPDYPFRDECNTGGDP